MSRWHRKSCKRPEVQLVGGLPFCGRCECMPNEHQEPQSLQSLGPVLTQVIPPPSKPGELHLSWPSSVLYYGSSEVKPSIPASGQPTGSDAGVTTASSGHHPPSLTEGSRLTHASLLQTDQVRLLTLSKGGKSDPLHGTLEVSYLHNIREYEALSYTWGDSQGDSTRSEVIYLGEFWDILPITANCERALRAVRYIDEPRILWIDSICIDQEDAPERSHQVGLMRQIYAAAWRVLVYLGEPSHDSELAMKLIGQIDDTFRPTKKVEKSSMANLFNRRYFNRTWIIQEVALAGSLIFYCGNSSAFFPPYAALRKTIEYATETQVAPPWMRHCQTKEKLGPRDLVHLVIQSQGCQCADPRDRIFALLGLLISPESEGLVADYSLPVEDVFIGLAAHALQNRALDRGEILRLAACTTSDYPGLPTWVPDWGRPPLERYNAMAEIKISADSTKKDSSKAELRSGEDVPWNASVHALSGGLSVRGILIRDFEDDKTSMADQHFTGSNNDLEAAETPASFKYLMECTVKEDEFSVTFNGLGESRRSIDNVALGACFCLFLPDGGTFPLLLERSDNPDEFHLLSAGRVLISSPSLDYSPTPKPSDEDMLFDDIPFDDTKAEESLIPIPLFFDSPLYLRKDAYRLCDYPLQLRPLSETEETFLVNWQKRLRELFPLPSDAETGWMDYWKNVNRWQIIQSLLSDSWSTAYRQEKGLWEKCSAPKEYLRSLAKDRDRLQSLLDEVSRQNGEPGWLWEHKDTFEYLEKINIWNIDKILCLLVANPPNTARNNTVSEEQETSEQEGHHDRNVPKAGVGGSTAANLRTKDPIRDNKVLRECLEAGQAILDLLQKLYSEGNPHELADFTYALSGAELYRAARETWYRHFRGVSDEYKRPSGFVDFSGWFAMHMLQKLITPCQGPVDSTSDSTQSRQLSESDSDSSIAAGWYERVWSWEDMERQMTERMAAWTEIEKMAKELKEATASIDLQLLMHKVISQAVMEPFNIDLDAKKTITII